MLALLREIRVCGSAKDLVELPEASPPESSPSLETVVSRRCITTTGFFVVIAFDHFYAVVCVTCACTIGRRAKFAELHECQHYA